MHKSESATEVTNITTSDNPWDNVDHVTSIVIGAGTSALL
ncbi:hypothetical protein Xbud_00634 [Xenorhabdus budapestensis]|uniref:Uncharacterized protein n=1 Tax=Xenorhabdus budapestensis TaxID=290110 RepID=A0A2D0J3W7_XENBU|nr:hypothetical protein Xbud_00634 [Xenorhabdus budapestensis]